MGRPDHFTQRPEAAFVSSFQRRVAALDINAADFIRPLFSIVDNSTLDSALLDEALLFLVCLELAFSAQL